jgi:hypothetical protein
MKSFSPNFNEFFLFKIFILFKIDLKLKPFDQSFFFKLFTVNFNNAAIIFIYPDATICF